LPAIDLDERTESDVEMIAVGAFSPLKGFMGSKDYLRVVRELRLENGLPWSIPISLAIPEDQPSASRWAGRRRSGRGTGASWPCST
jgi:ATP sulfurylase